MRILLIGLLFSFSASQALVGQTTGAGSDKGSTKAGRARVAGSLDQQADASLLAGLSERWRGSMGQLEVPGMAVVVVHNDKVILLEGFGMRDVRTKAPVTPDTVFFLADGTKPFAAMAVQQLVEQGRIDLDAPVRKYLPRFELAELDLSTSLTVRAMLSQSWILDSFSLGFSLDYSGEINEELFYGLLRKVRPEARFRRSSIPYAIVERVIRAASGMSWKEYVKKNILKPAGMNNTFCLASEMYARPDVALPLVLGDAEWRVLETRKSDRTMNAAGGVGASVRDLGRWLRLNLNGGQIDGRRILSEKRVEEMQAPEVTLMRRPYQFKREGFGLGWYISRYAGSRVVQQFGMFSGYRSNISILPEHNIGVAVLSNATGKYPHFVDVVVCDVVDRLLGVDGEDVLPKLQERTWNQRDRFVAMQPTGPNPVEGGLLLDPQAYVGKYTSDTFGILDVAYQSGLLTAKIGDQPLVLFSTGPNWFDVFVADKILHGSFEANAKGGVSAVTLENGPVQMHFKR